MRRFSAPPRPRALDVVCVGGFVVSLVYPLALTPLEPWLLGIHPVLVEAVLGTVESLVTAGAFARVGRAPLWLVIVAPLLCGDLLDPFSWWVGRRYGQRILARIRGAARYQAAAIRAEGFLRRWGVWTLVLAYYLPVPNALIYIAAGETGLSLGLFIVLDLVGTALGILPLILLGFAIGQSAVDLAQLVTRYAGISTVILLTLVVGYHAWRNRRVNRR